MHKVRLPVELVRELLVSEDVAGLEDRLDNVLNEVFRKALEKANVIDVDDEDKYWDLKLEASVRQEESRAELIKKRDSSTAVMDTDLRMAGRALAGMAKASRTKYLDDDHYEVSPVQEQLFGAFLKITDSLNEILVMRGSVDEKTAQFLKILNEDFYELLGKVYESSSEHEKDELAEEGMTDILRQLDELTPIKREGDAKPQREGKIIPFLKK